ncbi:hypothetical protein [Endozoicomonas montiporae]|uniref:hypothetical protein n=1 Tax=Endozoicomonas montiporae TaxID=1027273 RepID=UPI000A6FD4FF|nr:hypothetical protein [Endozoicomonas montiporae]
MTSKSPELDIGLSDAWGRLQQNDFVTQQVIYRKGALFWQALDQALQKHDSNLDRLLPFLITPDTKTILNARFQREVSAVIGNQLWKQLKSEYGIQE